MLKVKNISVSLPEKTILKDISFQVSSGDWLMIVGPNGAGKSTIINAISSKMDYTGEILLHKNSLSTFSSKIKATQIGILTQHHAPIYDFTVEAVVSMGRYAYGDEKTTGKQLIEDSIRVMDLTKYRHQSILKLSGGELQRVFLAQVLTQNPTILILDEPANHLDLKFQKLLYELIDQWRQEKSRAVISVVHDLSIAQRFGTHGLLIHQGKTVKQGPIKTVLQPEILNRVFEIDVYQWMKKNYNQWNN